MSELISAWLPLLALPVGLLLAAATLASLCCGWNPFLKQASYGSGANPIWNSFIDTNPPLPSSRKQRMKFGWRYQGSHGVPGSTDHPGMDHMTGKPLTGHLIGRQVWAPIPQGVSTPQYESFDASINRVSIFRRSASHAQANHESCRTPETKYLEPRRWLKMLRLALLQWMAVLMVLLPR
jgi:hypothetical protein